MYIKIATALNSQKKAVNGSKILFLGVAYKPNINDERESPALDIMDIIAHKGGNIAYHDPHISEVNTKEGHKYYSIDLTDLVLSKIDCVVLTTNHQIFDINLIKKNANLIVDLRNMVEIKSDSVFKL